MSTGASRPSLGSKEGNKSQNSSHSSSSKTNSNQSSCSNRASSRDQQVPILPTQDFRFRTDGQRHRSWFSCCCTDPNHWISRTFKKMISILKKLARTEFALQRVSTRLNYDYYELGLQYVAFGIWVCSELQVAMDAIRRKWELFQHDLS